MPVIRKEDILEGVERLSQKPVMIFGDCMLDHYQWGTVERISPEAPVPVVLVDRETWKLGGAGNVARNIKALGGNPHLVTIVGDDPAAGKIQGLLDEYGIAHSLVRSNRPTTIKTRIIAGNQQMLRVDKEKKGQLSPQTLARVEGCLENFLPGYGVIVVSDYGKGLISENILHKIQTSRSSRKVLLDPKTENYPLYHGHFIMTPNAREAGESAHGAMDSREEILEVGSRILKEKGLENLLITLGSRGMVLFKKDHHVLHIPTVARDVFDVTGAGDTVIAVLALCLSADLDLLTSCVIANCAAGLVVGQVGTAAVGEVELAQSVERIRLPEIGCWK
ncbi:MAG: bifunctional ADP-heptose synthase [Desulfoplanes sp.]|nr:bifunctional ADP-heptose synthase [Desulfoplanes sp.]